MMRVTFARLRTHGRVRAEGRVGSAAACASTSRPARS